MSQVDNEQEIARKEAESKQFQGFDQANTTAVPDVFFDELLPTLSGAECKVMLYIIRRTLGFKKSTDAISFNQFKNGITTHDGRVLDKGCGVQDRTTLSKALASLEAKNCIETTKGKNEKKINEITAYSIKFRSQGSREILPPVVGKSYQGSRETPQGVVGKSYPQLDSNTTNSLTNDTYSDASASDPHNFSDEELYALLRERGLPIPSNQPELSTPENENVEKSGVDPMATSNDPIATGIPENPPQENGDETQPELITRPEKPEMPPVGMRLSAEKLVQITEALRAKYYPSEQREKQIVAARKIIAKKVTEEQYIRAYQDRNDEWWQEHKGPLHVVHMAGKTTNGEMRVLEVLEQMQERKVVQFPTDRGRTNKGNGTDFHPELETDADREARDVKNRANLEKLRMRNKRREEEEAARKAMAL